MSRQSECIDEFLKRAKEDREVYITDVRRSFDRIGTLAFHIHVCLYEGETEVFRMALPEWENAEQKEFVAEYIRAFVFNLLCTLGALRVVIYLDRSNEELLQIAEGLREDFQMKLAKTERT